MMQDGDAHPDAIAETLALFDQGDDEYREAIGSLVFKRRETLRRGKFDKAFEQHAVAPDVAFHAIYLIGQHKGLVAVFDGRRDLLRLLAVVPVENFIYEMKVGAALAQALILARDRADD